MIVSPEQRDRIAANLPAWYRAHKRDLPWRGGSAYAVWISEIMLQQTQVATVIPFFLRFMARFPTLESLASAPIDDVLRQWAGLGYYARARNLHRAAQQIAAEHGGRLPDDPEAIERLPGIGRYTAGAILSIAYNVPRPLVDANVIRVLSRLFGLRGDPKASANQAQLWSIAGQLVPADNPGDFNQGLMELGALVCRPDDPLCEQCPLLRDCTAGNSSDPTALPEIPAGRATIAVAHSCAIILSEHTPSPSPPEAPGNGNEMNRQAGSVTSQSKVEAPTPRGHPLPKSKIPLVLLVQRPAHGLWGGLWEFPRVACAKGEAPEAAAVRAAREVAGLDTLVGERVGVVKHGVTHHRITLHGFLASAVPPDQEPTPVTCAAVRWVPLDDLGGYACSSPQTLMREALEAHFTRSRSAEPQYVLDL